MKARLHNMAPLGTRDNAWLGSLRGTCGTELYLAWGIAIDLPPPPPVCAGLLDLCADQKLSWCTRAESLFNVPGLMFQLGRLLGNI